MSATLPWSSPSASPGSTDPAESLRRIDRSVSSLVTWVKYQVFLTVVLIVVLALFII